MSSFSFCSSCVRDRERRFNCDSIYSIELDFVLICTFLRSFSLSEIQRWIVSLCDFLYVLFRFSFSYFSSIDCRLDHCEITISHYFFSIWRLYSTIEVENEMFSSHTTDLSMSFRRFASLYVIFFISSIVWMMIMYWTMFKFIHVIQSTFSSSINLSDLIVIKLILSQSFNLIAAARMIISFMRKSLSTLIVSQISILIILKTLNSKTLLKKLFINRT
jgi:hypothetical protein